MRLLAPLLAALALIGCTPAAQKAPEPASGAETPAVAEVTVESPAPGAKVTSPLVITGVAPNDWYFEGQFTAYLRGTDGQDVASAPARGQTDWTTPGPVPFRAEIPFDVKEDTDVMMILEEEVMGQDMPDAPAPRTLQFPLVLTPAAEKK